MLIKKVVANNELLCRRTVRRVDSNTRRESDVSSLQNDKASSDDDKGVSGGTTR